LGGQLVKCTGCTSAIEGSAIVVLEFCYFLALKLLGVRQLLSSFTFLANRRVLILDLVLGFFVVLLRAHEVFKLLLSLLLVRMFSSVVIRYVRLITLRLCLQNLLIYPIVLCCWALIKTLAAIVDDNDLALIVVDIHMIIRPMVIHDIALDFFLGIHPLLGHVEVASAVNEDETS